MKNNYFRLLLGVFAIGLFANNLHAQEAYLNVNAAYGFQMGAQTISANTSTYNSSTTLEPVHSSFGKGVNAGVAFGYMFNKNIGTEFDVSYLIGAKSSVVYSDKSSTNLFTRDITYSARMLRLIPSIVVSSGFEKVNPYAKVGLVIGYGLILFDINENDNGDLSTQKSRFYGGLAVGLSSGFGLIYKIDKKTSFFTELNVVSLSYSPTKGEVTEASINGVDQLPTMTTRQKEIRFVEKYTTNSGNTPSDSEPTKSLKIKQPFGSIGLNIGLKINL